MYDRTDAWPDPSIARNFSVYDTVEVQVIGAPTTAYTPTRSLDGVNFTPCNAMDFNFSTVTAINAPGIYTLPGSGFLRFSAGAGSSVVVRAGA